MRTRCMIVALALLVVVIAAGCDKREDETTAAPEKTPAAGQAGELEELDAVPEELAEKFGESGETLRIAPEGFENKPGVVRGGSTIVYEDGRTEYVPPGEPIPPWHDADGEAAGPARPKSPSRGSSPGSGRTPPVFSAPADPVEPDKPAEIPEKPTDAMVRWFVDGVERSFKAKSARFVFRRLAPDATIRLTMGDRSLSMDRKDWFARSMTSLQMVEGYSYDVADYTHTIDDDRVTLNLIVVEEYRKGEGTVRGSTAQTLELDYAEGDFKIRSMIATTTGEAID